MSAGGSEAIEPVAVRPWRELRPVHHATRTRPTGRGWNSSCWAAQGGGAPARATIQRARRCILHLVVVGVVVLSATMRAKPSAPLNPKPKALSPKP